MNYITIDNYAFPTRIIIIKAFSSILNIFYSPFKEQHQIYTAKIRETHI